MYTRGTRSTISNIVGSFVRRLVMVLGAILSVNQQLFNAAANESTSSTNSTNLFAINGNIWTLPDRNVPSDYNVAQVEKEERMPVFELVLGTITYLLIIAMTVVGNTMVVIAVFTYRPLKKVQNYFLVSLAASDLAVAVIVMPLHVVKFLANGRWLLGVWVCQLFTTFDILLCTSSILNLCAIAIDRYCAIHDPINYAQRRTPRFVCLIILLVWIVSGCISVPPLIGWNDWSSQKLRDHCELTTEKAFVVYSASGSFFVPLVVMVIVYMKIFFSARQRVRTNRGRSALLRITQQARDPRTTSVTTKANSTGGLGGSRKLIAERAPLVDVCSGMTNGDMSSENKHSDETNNTHAPKVRLTNTDHQASNSMPQVNKNGRTNGVIIGEQLTTTVLRKREKISVAKEKRAAKTIAVIIFVFTFCWMPFFCAYVILPFCKSCYLHPKVHQAFVWLGYINSSLNPAIYAALNLEFRRAFRRILFPNSIQGRRRSSAIRH
ncbi:7 transmembrane receptor [Aphelenchoides besseyi]|nr:7 transmembrane receptor [Aphelenchoides besseyi]KAI6201130.1 7 transmembrane receptor [Aphelenchoides besseyi]